MNSTNVAGIFATAAWFFSEIGSVIAFPVIGTSCGGGDSIAPFFGGMNPLASTGPSPAPPVSEFTLSPSTGRNASRYTMCLIRSGTRSATPVITIPP